MKRRSVALLIETSNAYARGLLEGVITYVRRHEAWSVYLPEQERGAKPPLWLHRWKGDGIIARIETDEIAAAVRQSRLPIVDVSAARHVPDIPWVETDDIVIAQLAAAHLLERGFRRLAYCGDAGFNWSNWRQEHFQRIVAEAQCEFHLHVSSAKTDIKFSWNGERKRMANWLAQMPKPVGIMACYDIRAQQLLDLCRELDIAVPEQVAVIGVDNDRLLCDLASPPLSSVIPNAHRSGYEAASLLDSLMQGIKVPAIAHLIKPLGVEARQSTNILAIDDPDVAKALRYIREHANQGINVSDLLRNVPISRRVLEHRFRQCLGRTPHEEILRLRVQRIKQLLQESDLSLQEIAKQTGFEHVEYLSTVFKRETGISPRAFRKEVRTV